MKRARLLVVALSLSPLVAGCAGGGSNRGSWASGLKFWDRNDQGITSGTEVPKAYYGPPNDVNPTRGDVSTDFWLDWPPPDPARVELMFRDKSQVAARGFFDIERPFSPSASTRQTGVMCS